jgi:hypothetical protein
MRSELQRQIQQRRIAQFSQIAEAPIGDSCGLTAAFIFIFLRLSVTKNSIERPIPAQWLYSGISRSRTPTPWFKPYLFSNGKKYDATIKVMIPITAATQDEGHCWRFSIPELAEIADGIGHSNRSPILLMEDGEVLGPCHTEHKKIREIGAGAFSHWNDALYFSTSDNTNPNINGRKYGAVVLE